MPFDARWVKHLREQYPPGTRIRLNQMGSDPRPVTPGTEGEVKLVDDTGTLHVAWDDGRLLGLIPGEDSFTVLPPQTNLLKLYMPMTVDYYEHNEYGDWDDEPVELSGREAVAYADNITAALLRERHPDEVERGMMTYYRENDSVNQKVRSYNFTAEVRKGKLWGVAECMVAGELTPDELALLKEDIEGQAADGIGESAEQHEIRTADGREIYAHLWSSGDDWSIQTEQELFSPKLAQGLPELCFSVLRGSGDLICIKRGEAGYYPSDWNTGDRERNQELADYNNQRLGVSQAQRLAMECGLMHGWTTPGTDPACYEQQQEQDTAAPAMGGMEMS